MSEQADAIGDLEAAGALDALAWAGWSSYRGVMADYRRPAAGHDQAWVGYTGHKFMLNRQDRAFSCEDFAVLDGDPDGGADLLQEGISEQEFRAMPRIQPGLVVRDNVNMSPGWKCGGWRWLLTSAAFGEERWIDWRRARATKRNIAGQPFCEGPDLFSVLEEEGEIFAWRPTADCDSARTLVAVHTADLYSGQFKGFIGHPKLNAKKGDMAWHWLRPLRDWGPGSRGRGGNMPFSPDGPTTKPVEDATVRLRRNGIEKNNET